MCSGPFETIVSNYAVAQTQKPFEDTPHHTPQYWITPMCLFNRRSVFLWQIRSVAVDLNLGVSCTVVVESEQEICLMWEK